MNLLRIQPTAAFSVNWTAYMMFIVVIGGFGTIEGPIIGAVIYFSLLQSLSQYGTLYMLLLGIIAVIMVTVAPKGIWGYRREALEHPPVPGQAPARARVAAGRRPQAGRRAGRRRGGVRLRPVRPRDVAGGPASRRPARTRDAPRRMRPAHTMRPADRRTTAGLAPGPGSGP